MQTQHNLSHKPSDINFPRFYLLSLRSTTLNDIYRTLGMSQKLNKERKLQRQDQFIDEVTEYKDEYEEGDVTGFMAEKPLPSNGINSFDVSSNFMLSKVARLEQKQEKIWEDETTLNVYAIFQLFSQSLPQATAGAKTGEFSSFYLIFLSKAAHFLVLSRRFHLEILFSLL